MGSGFEIPFDGGCGNQIENVLLDDDVLLETPRFDDGENRCFDLLSTDEAQALFLHAVLHKKAPDSAEAQFLQKGFLVLLENLLSDRNRVVPFYLRLAALFLRSKVEKSDLKTCFRAIAQLEVKLRNKFYYVLMVY